MLRRPYLIEERSSTALPPSENLDIDVNRPDIPSPSTVHRLEYETACLTFEISNVKDKTDSTAVMDLLQKFQYLLDSLPVPLRLDFSSSSIDKSCPRLAFERHKIHLDIFLSVMMLLKPFLLSKGPGPTRTTEVSGDSNKLREAACYYSIRLIDLAVCIQGLFFPERGKDYLISFAPFDTAVTLCIALQRDTAGQLLKRRELIIAVGKAISILSHMGSVSKVASQGFKILRELVANLSLSPNEKAVLTAESKSARDQHEACQIAIVDVNLHPSPPDALLAILGEPENPAAAAVIDPFSVERIDSLEKQNEELLTDGFNLDWENDIDLGILDDVFHWDLLYPGDASSIT